MPFEIGDRVSIKNYPQSRGLISGFSKTRPGFLIIEMDQYNQISTIDEKDLITIEEADQILAQQEAAKLKLEEEFKSVKEKIVEKIKEASVLITEAYELAGDCGKSLEEFQEMNDFLSENNMQWYQSAAYC